MARFNAEGKQYTAEQETQRDAEEKTWSDSFIRYLSVWSSLDW